MINQIILSTAVTTCPRTGADYLEETLDSLAAAGFEQIVISSDTEKIGSWPHFRKTCKLLLESNPDALCIFQDDVVCAKGLYDFTRKTLKAWHDFSTDKSDWKSTKNLWNNIGVVSLYTAGAIQRHITKQGWHRLADLPSYDAFGACAYVLTRESATALLKDNPSPEVLTGTDTIIGTWCRDTYRDYWIHSPSLVQHVGKHSAINDSYALVWEQPLIQLNRTASRFCDDVNKL